MERNVKTKPPVVLILGSVATDSVKSTLVAADRQYTIKNLSSSVTNWWSICKIFDNHHVQCVLVKLNGRTYETLTDPDYLQVREALFDNISKVPNVCFIFETLLSSSPNSEDLEDDYEDDFDGYKFYHPSYETRQSVNAFLQEKGIELRAYKRNAEISVMASKFVSDSEAGLIFRIYIPENQIWANECGKILQLFNDYLSRVGYQSVRLDEKRTGNGVLYEFYRGQTTEDPETGDAFSPASEFENFSELLALCLSDPARAEDLLKDKLVDSKDVSKILSKYSKEYRRISVDMKQEREQKMLGIKHRMENELVEEIPGLTDTAIEKLIDSVVPKAGLGNLLNAPSSGFSVNAAAGSSVSVIVNSRMMNSVASLVAEEINGNIVLNDSDKEILKLIEGCAPKEKVRELTSSLKELSDETISKDSRLIPASKLKAFLLQIASKGSEVATGVLTTYINSKLGLS